MSVLVGNQFVVKKVPRARGKFASPRPPTPPEMENPIAKTIKRARSRRFCTVKAAYDCKLVLPNRATFPELPFGTGVM